MSSLRVPWQNGPYKNKHTEQHKNTQNIKTQQTSGKNLFLCLTFNIVFNTHLKKWHDAFKDVEQAAMYQGADVQRVAHGAELTNT